jgi:hypothetical protein
VRAMARIGAKLSVASAGEKPQLSISDHAWRGIEKAYGSKLSSEVRNSILQATQRFVDWEVFERTAKPLSNVKKRLTSIRKAATQFRHELLGQKVDIDSRVFAKHLIKKHFYNRCLPEGDCIQQLSSILGSIAGACDEALNDLDGSEASGFRERGSWNIWVRQLTLIAEKNGLDHGISNEALSSGVPNRIPPFVILVDKLQALLPVKCRQHTQSPYALGQAIHRARAKRRGEKVAMRHLSDEAVTATDEDLFAYAIADEPATESTKEVEASQESSIDTPRPPQQEAVHKPTTERSE